MLGGRCPCFHPGTHRESSSESAQFVICRAGIPSQSCRTIKPLSILLMHRHTRLLLAGGGTAHSGLASVFTVPGGSWLQWLDKERTGKRSPARKGAGTVSPPWRGRVLSQAGAGERAAGPWARQPHPAWGSRQWGLWTSLTVFGCWLSCSLGGLDKSHGCLGHLPPCLHSGTLTRVSLRTTKDPGCVPCGGGALNGHHSPQRSAPGKSQGREGSTVLTGRQRSPRGRRKRCFTRQPLRKAIFKVTEVPRLQTDAQTRLWAIVSDHLLPSILKPSARANRPPAQKTSSIANILVCQPNTLIFEFTLHSKELQDKFPSKLFFYFHLRNLSASSLSVYLQTIKGSYLGIQEIHEPMKVNVKFSMCVCVRFLGGEFSLAFIRFSTAKSTAMKLP